MEILIKRFAFKDNYTVGRLYVSQPFAGEGLVPSRTPEGKSSLPPTTWEQRPAVPAGHKALPCITCICDTLEPKSCHLTSRASEHTILTRKAKGLIAIPTGTYEVVMSYSRTFKQNMPYLLGVKCFTGIMIHPGNYPHDTRGCILPGWNRRVGMVCGSRSAFALIMQQINEALARGEKITVTIKEI